MAGTSKAQARIHNSLRKWKKRRWPSPIAIVSAEADRAALQRGYGVRAWWSQKPFPGNFGDVLSCFIVQQVSGLHMIHTGQPAIGTLMAIGSIIKRVKPSCHVWGAGILAQTDNIEPQAHYHAVRGPITWKALRAGGAKCAEVFGDPVLLLPRLYAPAISQEYEIGLIPHYSNFATATKNFSGSDDVLIIHPLSRDPLLVVNDILRCRRIVSSSLHGIIVAQAYGKPAAWAAIGSPPPGDNSKFTDYFLSTGQPDHSPIDLTRGFTRADLDAFGYYNIVDFDAHELIRAFPCEYVGVGMSPALKRKDALAAE